MAQTLFPLVVLVILLEILQTGCCGGDSFDPFSHRNSRKIELDESELSKSNIFENFEEKQKSIEKRRLFFNEGEGNSPVTTEKQTESNDEYTGRRKTNYSEMENENLNQFSGHQQDYSNFVNNRNRFSSAVQPMNFKNPVIKPFMGQINSNQDYDWGRKTEVIENSKTQWNEEKNLQQLPNFQPNPMLTFNSNNFNRRPETAFYSRMNSYSDDEYENDFNKKVSHVDNTKSFNIGKTQTISGFGSHSNMNYFNRNLNGFWNPNFYKPEKGLVINFNTECPKQKQFNDQLVHKFIYSPKSPIISTQSSISSFQIPETSVISTHKITPMYYL